MSEKLATEAWQEAIKSLPEPKDLLLEDAIDRRMKAPRLLPSSFPV